ncbi:MAG: hypothetical protein IKF83_02175 [Clostridia bacterium]|nr:hypothetical protein [Clostridia bacterium]
MQKVTKTILVLILLFIILYAFSNSYSYDSIDNLAYVVAMGIDSTENDKIKVSFQFTDTSAFSSEGSSGNNSTIINTVEAKSIESATNLLNSYIGKNVNLAHCKVIVFSEEVAKAGLSDYIYSLINDSQIRPTSNIVISRCDAKYYMENSISKYEKILTKYYDVFPNSADYTGYISDVTLGKFFNQMQDKSSNPIAILGGINTTTSDVASGDTTDANILANQSTIVGERGTENIGLAVFSEDHLIGELTALEALCHSIIANEADSFLISIPSPKDDKTSIDLSINQYKKTNIDVDVSTGSPYITIDLYLFAKVLSVDTNTDYLNDDYLNSIRDASNTYLSSRITEYLYKTSKEFKSCVDDFDKFAVKKFLTNKDWEAFNWKSSYPNAFFKVNVNTKVNSSLLLTES